MKQWVVYKHTSMRSGKSYIGITSQGIETRWVSHVNEANRGSERHFHRAIRLYGADNWYHEVLVEAIDTLEEAYQLERYYIKSLDTLENGYNLSEGGEGNAGLQLPEYFTVHVWCHASYGETTCTGEELMLEYGIQTATMRSYLRSSGDTKSVKQVDGWVIKGRNALPKQKITGSTEVTVYHDGYGKFVGSIKELSLITGKEVKHLSKLVKGIYKQVAGWRTTVDKPIVKTSNKKVYVVCDNVVVHVYDSSCAASRDLGLRDAQMSEWLLESGSKAINEKVYYYEMDGFRAGDRNIGMV